LVTSFGSQRYILGVDPGRGVNLRGLGALLNLKEQERREAEGKLLTYRWYEGNCPFFNYRIIDSPQDGTALKQKDVLDCLWDFSRSLS
jgi:hypothetical protein